MNNLPWIIYASRASFKITTRFGTEAEARMHVQSLNRICRGMSYKIRFMQHNHFLE
jgi:hypothetical protein